MRRSAGLGLCCAAAVAVFAMDDGSPLTREELAACVADERSLHARNEALAARRAELEAELTELQALGARIESGRSTLDDTDADAVAAYNALIDQHQTKADAFNAKLPAINTDIAALNAARDALDARCAHRPYDARDLDAWQHR